MFIQKQSIQDLILKPCVRSSKSERWIQEAGAAQGLEIGKDAAREYVYGMTYETWRAHQQTEATEAQKAAFKPAHD